MSILAFVSLIRFLFFEITSPAVENTLSLGTLLAGIVRYFVARLYSPGCRSFPTVDHHCKGFLVAVKKWLGEEALQLILSCGGLSSSSLKLTSKMIYSLKMNI